MRGVAGWDRVPGVFAHKGWWGRKAGHPVFALNPTASCYHPPNLFNKPFIINSSQVCICRAPGSRSPRGRPAGSVPRLIVSRVWNQIPATLSGREGRGRPTEAETRGPSAQHTPPTPHARSRGICRDFRPAAAKPDPYPRPFIMFTGYPKKGSLLISEPVLNHALFISINPTSLQIFSKVFFVRQDQFSIISVKGVPKEVLTMAAFSTHTTPCPPMKEPNLNVAKYSYKVLTSIRGWNNTIIFPFMQILQNSFKEDDLADVKWPFIKLDPEETFLPFVRRISSLYLDMVERSTNHKTLYILYIEPHIGTYVLKI